MAEILLLDVMNRRLNSLHLYKTRKLCELNTNEVLSTVMSRLLRHRLNLIKLMIKRL